MSFDFRIGALALGALLLLAAVSSALIFGSAWRTRSGTYARAAAGVVGAALIIAALVPYLGSPRQPALQPAAAPAATQHSSVDLVGTAGSAVAACVVATAPAVPNGATASLKEMRAARTAFQAYDGATNSYLHCVDSTIERVAKQFAGEASPADLQALQTFGVRAHDTAVDQEQAVADQFNSQIRTFKAKHPRS